MKNHSLLILAVFLIISSSSTSQIILGLRGGVGLAKVRTSDSDHPYLSSMARGNFGAIAGFAVKKYWIVQSGLSFTGKGMQLTQSGIATKYKLNYAEIPLMISYLRYGQMLYAGPYVSYLFSGKYTVDEGSAKNIDFSEVTLPTFNSNTYNAAFNRTEYGINVGWSFMTLIGKKNAFGIDIRGTWGLSELLNIKGNPVSSANYKTSYFSINMVYMYIMTLHKKPKASGSKASEKPSDIDKARSESEKRRQSIK